MEETIEIKTNKFVGTVNECIHENIIHFVDLNSSYHDTNPLLMKLCPFTI